jgi:hypothetical protein
MPSIDIPLSPSLQKAFDLDPCDVLSIPAPAPLKITLPSGSALHALNDISKGIPNDCSMSFNLMLQLAPLLAALECPLKVLKLLKPLVDAVTGPLQTPPSPPTPEMLKEIAEAVIDLAPCFAMPAALVPFVKDILCLVRAVLRCLLEQIRSMRDLLDGLALERAAAEGNDDLMAVVDCASKNADASMKNLTSAIEPVGAFLGVLGPIMKIAKMDEIKLEVPGGADGAEALDPIVDTLQALVDTIDNVTGGACGA